MRPCPTLQLQLHLWLNWGQAVEKIEVLPGLQPTQPLLSKLLADGGRKYTSGKVIILWTLSVPIFHFECCFHDLHVLL